MRRSLVRISGVGAALLAAGGALAAQSATPRAPRTPDVAALLPTMLLAGPPPAPGHEAELDAGRALEAAGWRRDGLGSFVLRRGSGSPRRVVACALDQPTFVVSDITDDGYLRLHDPADPRRHPLWTQFLEGQRVVVSGVRGDVPGVVGVRSTHLWRRRPPQESPATVDDLWLDVGARTQLDVERLGIRLLAPVRRDQRIVVFGADSVLTAPAMAARAGCAAVASAARGTPASGETVFVLAAQSAYSYAGLNAVLARIGPVDSVVVVDAGLARGSTSDSTPPDEAVTVRMLSQRFGPRGAAKAGAVVAVGVRSLFPGTLVEGVSTPDALALRARVAALAGVHAPRGSLLTDMIEATSDDPPSDSARVVAELLGRLAGIYGVSGHEQTIRDGVRAELPASLRSRTTVDSAGNLILALGPERDTTVFVAHLDEIGYEVKAIGRDGTVSLTPRGGFFASLWEGQSALLHFDDGAESARRLRAAGCKLPRSYGPGHLVGVFVPRRSATKKQPDAQTAWFGTDSAGLAACGVHPGMAVTGVKSAQRLAGTRFTARSVDDRVGCTALLLALRAIDPAKLTHKVIFVWSVREETGLDGAAALAAELGPSVHRVHAVDTFVSSDSPLESHRFAYTPLGGGAVVRALDNSSATPPAEVERVLAIARRADIPIQVGTTNGGNDGAELARFGAVDVPLSWPARYSHSPVETIDLKDVDALAKLIAALANE